MSNLFYNQKFYTNFFFKKCIALSLRVSNRLDRRKDKKICGVSLGKYVPSLYRESMGATGSQSTCYRTLDKIFKGSSFSASDSFIDVGCGKGRVLAYMVNKKVPCSITGIELNEEVAAYAADWAKKYENVRVISGSAFDLDYNDYTVLFMGRPFEPEMFYKFIDKLETELTHPIKLYYWVDQQSGNYLDDRKGWEMHKREKVFNIHGLFVARSPQRYSIWTYTPNEK